MSEQKETKFGGLFGSLKKMVFTEDYLEAAQPSAAINTIPTTPPKTEFVKANSGIVTSNIASDEMVNKIYSLFESINKPGIDFFELWNAAEAMGGTTAINLQNAFTSFKVLGLDKNTVLQSGENYIAELQSKLGQDIQQKENQKQALIANGQSEKKALQNKKQELEEQLAQISNQLAATNKELNVIDTNQQVEIQKLETKIVMGKNALNTVVNEISGVMQTIKTSVN
jgi:hypothetical protein